MSKKILKKKSNRENKVEEEYDVHYKATTLILLFFVFSLVGWLWEVGLHLVTDHAFVDRGTMYGPWLPIYGTGGILAIVLLKRFAKNPIITFLLMMLISGVIEYATSYYLEMIWGVEWWNYKGYFLNLNGRICLEGLVIFGLGGCACIYFIAPHFKKILVKIPNKIKISLCIVLIILFIGDGYYSHFHPNEGKGITEYSIKDS